MNSSDSFIQQFSILADSAVGIILTHAREPMRAAEAVKKWAFTRDEKSYRYAEWDCLRGWGRYTAADDPNKLPPFDTQTSLLAALKKIGNPAANEAETWNETACAMIYPHWEIGKIAQVIQCLKLYARDFTETSTHLVLIVPEGFQLPRELENDVTVLDFDLPTHDELRAIYDAELANILKRRGLKRSPFTEETVAEIIACGSGMTESEFASSVARAYATHRDDFPKVTPRAFTDVVRKTKTEIVQRSQVLELVPPLAMENLGGLDLFKPWLQSTAVCFRPDARDFGVDMPKGFALIGPPGTGKSLGAKVTGDAFGLPLIRIDISKVFASHIGDSEANMRAALKTLKAMSPCIAWVDEVDKAGLDPRQASGDSGIGKRVMGLLLYEMQEDTSGMFWIFTANRTQGLGSELLRKGRLDEVFAVLPPNDAERLEVLNIHLRKRKQDPDTITDLQLAVDRSEGYVSAEIEAAVKEAVKAAYVGGTAVTGETITRELANMKPLSVAFADDFNEMKKWAENNARLTSTASAGALTRTRTRAVR